MVAAYGTWRFGLQSLVWCGAVDYVSRLRDGAAYGTWRFGFTGRWSGVELWVMCPVCGMLLPMVLGALVYRSLVWCGAVGYVSGLRDAARAASRKPDT